MFFRGTTDKTLSTLIQNNIQAFEDVPLYRRAPNVSLEPHFVYGFLSSEKRNTLFYGHYIPPKDGKAHKHRKHKDLGSKGIVKTIVDDEDRHAFMNKNSSLFIHPQTQKAIMFAKEMPGAISYDQDHDNCDRFFVYFVSRIAIVYDPITNSQRFYEGHRYQITSMCMHPSSTYNFLIYFNDIRGDSSHWRIITNSFGAYLEFDYTRTLKNYQDIP